MSDSYIVPSSQYKEYLNEIWTSRWGSGNRSPIHDAARTLQDAFDTDITEELETIASATKGEDMRVAIHDALYKLNVAKPDPPAPTEEAVKMSDLYSENSIVEHGGAIAPIDKTDSAGLESRWDITSITTGSKSGQFTQSMKPRETGIALVFIVNQTNDPVTLTSSGWELVVNGEVTTAFLSKRFVVYKKQIDSSLAPIEIQLEKAYTTEAWGFLIFEYGASGVSVIDNDLWGDTSAEPYSPTAKTLNRRLYAVMTARRNTPVYMSSISFENFGNLDLKIYQNDNYTFFANDYQKNSQITPKISYYTPDTSGAVASITLDILEG